MRAAGFILGGAALAAIAVGGGGWALSQERELRTGISESGFTQIRLALPAFVERSSDPAARLAAQDLREIVWNDLEFSGYFRMVDRHHYSLVPAPRDGKIPFEDWASIGGEYLFVGEAGKEGARLLVEGRLHDTAHAQMIFGKRYRSEPELFRTVGHRLADDIILHFTGRHGVAHSQVVFSGRSERGKEIYVMDYDGARLRQVTHNGSLNLSPAWSPDGEQIAFISYQEGWPRLFLVDRSGKQSRPLPVWEGELTAAPEWSPDGKWLALASNRDGNTEIYKMEVKSGRLVRLTHHRSIDSSPTWSPTGREIAFTSDRGGSPQVYIMDSDGLNVRRLTMEGEYNDLAAWAPQGDRIAYAGRDGTFDIHVIEVATQQARRLTFGPGNNESPRWSPDGRHLVFTSTREGESRLYAMDADGGRVRRIGPDLRADSPDWSR
jgi:TolB protein